MSSEQVERLTGKEKRYDSEDAVLIIDGVEYDVLALWGHVEALEQSLEASQQENERLRKDRVELAAILQFSADNASARSWGLQSKTVRDAVRASVRKHGFADHVDMWKEDADEQ